MFQGKKMYKVLCPMTAADGGTYWKDLGRGFDNRDNSINMSLDVLPLPGKDGRIHIQLREMSEQELRERAERRQSYAARSSQGASGRAAFDSAAPRTPSLGLDGSTGTANPLDSVPF